MSENMQLNNTYISCGRNEFSWKNTLVGLQYSMESNNGLNILVITVMKGDQMQIINVY